MNGLVSGTINWFTHPAYSEGSVKNWVAFLFLAVMVLFLWKTTVDHVAEG